MHHDIFQIVESLFQKLDLLNNYETTLQFLTFFCQLYTSTEKKQKKLFGVSKKGITFVTFLK